MNKFNKPEKFSGKQLIEELKAGGISIADGQFPLVDGNDDFWLPIKDADIAKAEPIIAAHIPVDASIRVEAEKQIILDRLGITAEQAKLLLA